MQGLLAERTAEVVVQTPLHTVLTESVTAGGGDRLVEKPEEREGEERRVNHGGDISTKNAR